MKIEDLLRFIDQLRLAGFDISTQQYIAAQNVLIGLAAQGCWPSDPRALRTWLAPVVCSSPHEQENFYRRFDHWIEQRVAPPQPPKPVIGPDGGIVSRNLRALSDFVRHVSGRDVRLLGLTAAATIAVIAGIIFIPPLVPRTLSGRVIDKETKQTLAAARVSFGSKNAVTNSSGTFSFSYRPKELPQELTVACDNYETTTQRVISGSNPELVVELQGVEPPRVKEPSPSPPVTPSPTQSQSEDRIFKPPPAVVPIPLLAAPPAISSYWRWILLGTAVLPLVPWGLWMLWQKRLRALLEKLRTAADPRLEEIVVKGAAGNLFSGQTFRRTIQELRRHRQKGANELDVQRTVDTTIRRGGLFSPRYGARHTLPEYLVLIDRAGFEDQQARLDEEIVSRLVRDNVFVDAYFFHGDPRVCRKRDNAFEYVQLQDLAALHSDHHLVIFTDGSSFLNPITGGPEPWVEMFSAWTRRAILTPEPAAYWGRREWLLTEMEFVVLPATQGGLAALSELVDGGASPAVDVDPQARPYPELLRERERRWLEDHDPRPAEAEKLCDQLKLFLGSKGYFWLSACAVYPVLRWDLTLYFGFKLFTDRTGIEERLLSLVRLPWFRYGTIPEWLRRRLIDEMSQTQERTVRRALEELFLTVLDQPPDGIHIEYAADETPSFVEKLRKRIARWKFKRLFWRFLKDKKTESPLRDYVFVTFMAGRKPRKLTVSLPAAIRRLFFPDGQLALGLRTVCGLALSIAASLALILVTWQLTQPSSAKTNSTSPLYLQMSSQQQMEFIRERATQISLALDRKDPVLDEGMIASIKPYVDYYANRVGNKSSEPWVEDLSIVVARGSQAYAPAIVSAFNEKKLSPLLGLYLPMSYTEFVDYERRSGFYTSGIFQLSGPRAYSRSREDSADAYVKAEARAAAEVLDRMRGIIAFPLPSVLILSYKRGPYQINDDMDQLFRESKVEPSCWDFQSNARFLDAQFQNEDIIYVPKFFAAAIVGENPKSFGLDMEPLSTYTTIVGPTAIEQRVADLIAKFSGEERRTASDEIVQLYAENKAAVVNGLVNALLTDNGPNQYRVNLYIARTLGSIQPSWDGTVEQFNRVRALTSTNDYKDRTFKDWVDKAVGNFNVKNFIDCDCASLGPGLGQCSKVEADLIQQFRTTGSITGKCDPSAQGPNAKPSDARPAPTPTPPQQQQTTPGATSSPGVTPTLSVTPPPSPSPTPPPSPPPTPTITPDGIVIPDFRGKIVDGDLSLPTTLRGIGLDLGPVTYEESQSAQSGTVIRQNPPPGTRVPKGTRVSFVVAKPSDDLVEVPNVIGMTVDLAEKELFGRGLKSDVDFGAVSRVSGQTSMLIASQSPAAGTKVKRGTLVRLKACRNRDCV